MSNFIYRMYFIYFLNQFFSNRFSSFVANNQNLRMSQPQSYYCTYLPGQNLQSNYYGPGSSNVPQNAADYRSHENAAEDTARGVLNTIVAPGHSFTDANSSIHAFPVHCEEGFIPCLKVNQCIKLVSL